MSDLSPALSTPLPPLARGRPLVVCDADEVIVDFMPAFEAFLAEAGIYYTWRAYRLDGELRCRADDRALSPAEVRAALARFYAERIDTLAAVDGAAEGIARLARRAQVVILSNVPATVRERRQAWLERHGIAAPLIANHGDKGPIVGTLAARAAAPAYFVDDSPRHHESVARNAPAVCRIHFVADRRLARLLGPAPASHVRIDAWPPLCAYIERDLAAREG